ncbi:copper/silver-translocating P-type ATPase,heavy metal-translocating P-type ATPase, Cd/Co/Hg/Pb/Zn-transporting [Caldisphaera lagunensis DSM 15908]|uniref:Copper/silver-translocating P-type ATPase,heavy metal-translocating P-type ATPase, Cd/Co/Hg/Pb/Zn-transporting n=1 Tax=Caldisphaera lagunensis (strain DSM 15908 / JCM 11604 / ANMR 0165 / IC-154) TaxID=1056495 RepID=L0A9V9_CALLD|nr:cation-translocating P-type ATPase [Caldisphaera lagunensis]AFZ70636.1 copper/silver-translocating P-type ATPase,heavy metal-translocating P-type ATPase, Cd/Co/Hg/Pb/Zn-transporting [Caldisphaera lagunensis DSM 15908]
MNKNYEENKEEKKGLRINKEQQIKVIGMHCATCAITVSNAIKKVNGVENAEVNLATGDAKITGNLRLKDVVKNIRNSGYDVLTQKIVGKININPEEITNLKNYLESIDGIIEANISADGLLKVEFNPLSISTNDIISLINQKGYKINLIEKEIKIEELERKEFHTMLSRLFVAVIFSAISLFFEFTGLNLYALIASLPVYFYSGYTYHKGFIRATKNKSGNMDTLVSLSSSIAFFYSIYALISGLPIIIDVTVLLITFVLIGKTLESYFKYKLSMSVKSSVNTKVKKIINNKEVIVDVSEVNVGDTIILKSGDQVPVDGIIDEGIVEVNESVLTGEPIPVKKGKGLPLFSGSTIVNGYAKLYVTRSGENSYINQVAKSIREAQAIKLPIQNLVDRVSAIFVPIILIASILSLIIWHFFLGKSLFTSMLFAIAVLASACPCALGLATPMAVVATINKSVKKGIIIRNGEIFSNIKNLDTIVFDLTGTLTEGKVLVRSYKEFLPNAIKMAASVESLSNHPIAKAISDLSNEKEKVEEFEEFVGEGVYGKINDNIVIVGRKSFVKENCDFKEMDGDIFICINGKLGGIINIGDKLREGIYDLFNKLRERNVNIIIATGKDNVDYFKEIKVFSGLRPEDKVELIRKLKDENHYVAFVGDGINDAQALAEANIGIAINSGTDLAKTAGDVIIGDIRLVDDLFDISNKLENKIKQNLAWAFGYNSVLVPIAAGILYPIFYLPPEFAALAMSFSSVIVSLWSYL